MPNRSARSGLRRDALANREKLIAAAQVVFADGGVSAPLEAVARRAGVSIGTLYNNFPTRGALLDEIYPAKFAGLDTAARIAVQDPDPWHGFRSFLFRVFELQASDRGLNEAMTARYPDAAALATACEASVDRVSELLVRAQQAGAVRADYATQDLAFMIWSTSRVIAATVRIAPNAWRRFADLQLDGLRAESAHPLSAPPLSPEQLAAALLAE